MLNRTRPASRRRSTPRWASPTGSRRVSVSGGAGTPASSACPAPLPVRLGDGHVRRHPVGSPLLGRDRAAPLVDRRPALPDHGGASARADRDGGSTPEDRPHHDARYDVVLEPAPRCRSRSASARSSARRVPSTSNPSIGPAPARAEPGSRSPGVTLTEPMVDRLGIRIMDTGVAEVDHRADVLNSSNSIQGGVLAFVAEVAAQSLATEHAGRTFVVDDLDVRYLRAARSARAGGGVGAAVLRDRRDRRSGDPGSRCRQPHGVVRRRPVCRARRVTIRRARSCPTWWERTPPPARAPRGSGGHPGA